MAEMFTTLGTWNWLIFGFILMALELAAPGVFLFWLGLAALLVGLVSFALHPSWQTQLLMFAVFALAAVPVWRRLLAHAARPRAQREVHAAAPVRGAMEQTMTDHADATVRLAPSTFTTLTRLPAGVSGPATRQTVSPIRTVP